MKHLNMTVVALVLAVSLVACGGGGGDSSQFSDIQTGNTEAGTVVSGRVSSAGDGGNVLFAYFTGGAEDGWQRSPVGDSRFALSDDGGFSVTLTNPATQVTLYLAPRNADYSTLEALEKVALAKITVPVDVVPPVATTTPATTTTVTTTEPSTTTTETTTTTTEPTTNTTTETTTPSSTEATTESSKTTTQPTPVSTPAPTPTPGTTPTPFILFYDDGAAQDNYGELAYMGSDLDGDDGSMTANLNDESQATAGTSSARFTYTAPASGTHWAGMMFLYGKGKYREDPGDKGPDLSRVTHMSFYVKGSGGAVKFFVECDGGAQSAVTLRPTKDWQQVTLEVDEDWNFNNIPFGWACAERDADARGKPIEFWVDDVRFE